MLPIYEEKFSSTPATDTQPDQELIGYIYHRHGGGFDLKIRKEWIYALSQEGGAEEV